MNEFNYMDISEKDPGQNAAEDCWLFGLLSLVSMFLCPAIVPLVLSIIGLSYYKTYQKIGSGQYVSKANTGRILSIITIVFQIVGVVFVIACVCIFFLGMGEFWQQIENTDWHEIMKALE